MDTFWTPFVHSSHSDYSVFKKFVWQDKTNANLPCILTPDISADMTETENWEMLE